MVLTSNHPKPPLLHDALRESIPAAPARAAASSHAFVRGLRTGVPGTFLKALAVGGLPKDPPAPEGGAANSLTPAARRSSRPPAVPRRGTSLTCRQSGMEANFKNPSRSGNRSISDAITAGSIFTCSLEVVDVLHSPGRRVLDCVVCVTSRCPMSFDANSEVPPRSLAEHLKISVLPQFSTIVSATPAP